MCNEEQLLKPKLHAKYLDYKGTADSDVLVV